MDRCKQLSKQSVMIIKKTMIKKVSEGMKNKYIFRAILML